MFGMKKKNLDNENIKNPPTDDSYPMVATLFEKNNKITVNTLSLAMLELIAKSQMRCEIGLDESYAVGKKLTSEDMEVMKKITLRIANKGELKTSETAAINLLKNMNQNKKFDLKSMAKRSNAPSTANRFEKDFTEFAKALQIENDYDGEKYRDLLDNGKLTKKGKQAKKDWKGFRDYLKSGDLSAKYPPESDEENTSQIIYGACFDVEKDALAARQNSNELTDFIDKDGYKLLNIIFNNALSNVTEKRKGDGIFYGVNDKYTVPGA